MAQNFVSIDDAAAQLGISKEKLNEFREQGEVRAFRDGSSWKFKQDEIDKLAANMPQEGGEEDAFDIDLDMDSGDDAGADSILVSELEEGDSSTASSTIIGKSGEASGADSDVKLADDDDLSPVGEGSGLEDPSGLDSAGDDQSGAGSDLSLDDVSEFTLDDDDLDSSDVSLTGAGDSEVDLSGSDVGSGSALELAADEDDELVLGEGSGSDITLSSEDSGIGLAAAADSGISLDEEPMELGGSTVESLELGEDDDEVLLEEDTDSEAATQLKADDDFMLTPLEDSGGEETEDSGSQVIALDSESFDESADTMLGAGDSAFPADDHGAAMADQLGGAGALGTGAGPAAMMPQEHYVPEASYSVWNVMSLVLCFGLLAMSGMMMFDLIRNMWSWDQPYAANSAIMDALVELLPPFK